MYIFQIVQKRFNLEIRSLHRELTMMKDLPGPAMCKKCHVVAMCWKKLTCGHLLCHACLQKGIDARQEEIVKETKAGNKQIYKVGPSISSPG